MTPVVGRPFLIQALVGEVRRLSTELLEALYVPVGKRLLRRLVELHTMFGSTARLR